MGVGCVFLIWAASDCVTSATPVLQTCPTTTESVTFAAAGSCGSPGQIMIATMPGLCELEVLNGPAVGLPEHGNFSGAAGATHYAIGEGNWTLDGKSSDPAADPSSIHCTATPAMAPNTVTVSCNVYACVPSGDDTGFMCTESTCIMHLTPPGPDAGTDASEAGADAAGMEAASEAGAEGGD
jgi:hypothetical protein